MLSVVIVRFPDGIPIIRKKQGRAPEDAPPLYSYAQEKNHIQEILKSFSFCQFK